MLTHLDLYVQTSLANIVSNAKTKIAHVQYDVYMLLTACSASDG